MLNFYDSAALRQPVCIGEVSVTFFQKKKKGSNVNFSIVFLLLFPSNQTEENRKVLGKQNSQSTYPNPSTGELE